MATYDPQRVLIVVDGRELTAPPAAIEREVEALRALHPTAGVVIDRRGEALPDVFEGIIVQIDPEAEARAGAAAALTWMIRRGRRSRP